MIAFAAKLLVDPLGPPATWEGFGSSGTFSAVGGAVLLVLGVALGAWVVMRMRSQDRLRQGPAYRRLSRALGLGRRDRTLVWLVAREARLPCPASLLISRGCFDHAARRSVSRPGRSRRLAAIRQRVFESG